MIFFINKKEKEKINNLIETKYYNDEIADFINDAILKQKFQKDFLNNVAITALDINKYLNDEYYRSIKADNITIGSYILTKDFYKPYEVFLYDDLDVDEEDYYLIHNHLGYFAKEYHYLSLKKDNVTWMSVIPHEINTMQKLLTDADEVYVCGLGIGYYPFYLKKSKKITIIDSDKTVIDIFNKHLLPHFPNKDSINIVNQDAFAYLKSVPKEAYIFVDLWHDYRDGLSLYYRAKKELKDYQHVFYWLEENLIASFRHLFIDLIEEELYHPHEYDYSNAKDDNEILINKLHQYFINKKITSYQEIKELLTTDNLKKIIAKI